MNSPSLRIDRSTSPRGPILVSPLSAWATRIESCGMSVPFSSSCWWLVTMTWEEQAASNMQSTKTSAMEGWIVTSGSSMAISRGLKESSPRSGRARSAVQGPESLRQTCLLRGSVGAPRCQTPLG